MSAAILAGLKTALKKIAIHILADAAEKNEFDRVIVGILVFIMLISQTIFAFICLNPVSILSSFFLGMDYQDVVDIKTSYGYMQEQDKKWIQNERNEQTGADGTLVIDENYSDIDLPESSTDVVYYNQADKRWADYPYAGTTSYWASCGPTAMAIVVASLKGKDVKPPDMMDWSTAHGYAVKGAGTAHSFIPASSKAFGLKCVGLGKKYDKVEDALSEGKLVVALMGPGHFTKNGHFIVLRGIDSNGKILVADPSSTKRTKQSWDLSLIKKEAIHWASSGGPFWVISN